MRSVRTTACFGGYHVLRSHMTRCIDETDSKSSIHSMCIDWYIVGLLQFSWLLFVSAIGLALSSPPDPVLSDWLQSICPPFEDHKKAQDSNSSKFSTNLQEQSRQWYQKDSCLNVYARDPQEARSDSRTPYSWSFSEWVWTVCEPWGAQDTLFRPPWLLWDLTLWCHYTVSISSPNQVRPWDSNSLAIYNCHGIFCDRLVHFGLFSTKYWKMGLGCVISSMLSGIYTYVQTNLWCCAILPPWTILSIVECQNMPERSKYYMNCRS